MEGRGESNHLDAATRPVGRPHLFTAPAQLGPHLPVRTWTRSRAPHGTPDARDRGVGAAAPRPPAQRTRRAHSTIILASTGPYAPAAALETRAPPQGADGHKHEQEMRVLRRSGPRKKGTTVPSRPARSPRCRSRSGWEGPANAAIHNTLPTPGVVLWSLHFMSLVVGAVQGLPHPTKDQKDAKDIRHLLTARYHIPAA